MNGISGKQRILHLALGLALAVGSLAAVSSGQAWAQAYSDAVRQYNQGIEVYNQGRLAEALKKFETATRLSPAYADAYYNMGSIYYQMKNYEDAREMFQKTVNLSPGDGQARYNLALALEKQMRLDEASSVLAQIPPSDPKYAQAKGKLEEWQSSLRHSGGGTPHATTTPAAAKPAAAATGAATSTAPAKLKAVAFSKGFDGPTGIVIGPGGFMYVANYSKNLIYKVGANGDKSIFAQGENLIKGPIGLAYNPRANELYVANYLLNNVVRITAGGKVSTIVPNLTKPYNLYYDSVNNALFISEQDPANLVSRVTLPKP